MNNDNIKNDANSIPLQRLGVTSSPFGVGGRVIQPAERLNSISEYYFSTN